MKIGNIVLSGWHIGYHSIYRVMLVDEGFCFNSLVGFCGAGTKPGTHEKNRPHQYAGWSPQFRGEFSFLLPIFYTYAKIGEVKLFTIEQADQAMEQMDRFIIRMNNLCVFI